MNLDNLIETIVAERIPLRFVSPHLDDAALSCGNLMTYLLGKTDMEVWTVFTEASAPPYTLSAKAFLSQCGISDANRLFRVRKDEDKEVLDRLRSGFRHLGHPDALFRRRKVGLFLRTIARLVPEFDHAYPTYRWHVVTGRVALSEEAFQSHILSEITEGVTERVPILFFPLGLGKHVDHVLVREVGLQYSGPVVFYSDFPYSLSDRPDQGFLDRHGLRSHQFGGAEGAKRELIGLYGSQHLFEGDIPVVSEEYFFRDAIMKV
ncbi:MAG: PIG-L family deacetylase [Candidatus Moranbacteria bacterium]|nr:PIG-L family deacetylase [Candidatus Moranbacteria bacterium]